jgi:hypothetical protein
MAKARKIALEDVSAEAQRGADDEAASPDQADEREEEAKEEAAKAARAARRLAVANLVLTACLMPVLSWFLNEYAKDRDNKTKDAMAERDKNVTLDLKNRDQQIAVSLKELDQRFQVETLQAQRRAKEDDSRAELLLKLLPLVLGTAGKSDNCGLVLAEWHALYPSSPDMVREVSDLCDNHVNARAPTVTDWGINIGTDALLEQACAEAKRARSAGFDKVDVYYFPHANRHKTILYGFADRSAAALAEIEVRAKIRPGVVGEVGTLTARGQKKECPP